MVVLRDLRSMFWGVTIDGGKRYTQTVERSFHISMAALEAVPEGNSSSKHLSQVSVMINHDKAEFLLCTLNHKHLLQQTLDLNFTEGEEVTFFLNGQGVVHLTGYLLEDQMDESPEDYTLGTDEEEELMEEMSDEFEESDEAPDLVNIKMKKKLKQLELTPGSKRKATDNDTPKKKLKLEELNEDESDEEDDSEDDDWDEDEFADFIDDEAEEEESDEEEDEEDIVESKTPQGKNQSTNAQKKKMKDKQDKKDDEEQSKETKATPQNSSVAGGDANASSKKKKKKKKKKNKGQEAGSNQQTAAGEQQQSPKPQQQTPKPQQQQQKTPKKQVLAGGVLMEDLKVGNGPDAKKGKMVHVYYVGRLNNGKEFDSCKSGKPFRFRLGKFEVIKGWEIGIEGMKVGGKRRLTVPPQQGYGSQKQGEIPPNSTLIFDVELKAVS